MTIKTIKSDTIDEYLSALDSIKEEDHICVTRFKDNEEEITILVRYINHESWGDSLLSVRGRKFTIRPDQIYIDKSGILTAIPLGSELLIGPTDEIKLAFVYKYKRIVEAIADNADQVLEDELEILETVLANQLVLV